MTGNGKAEGRVERTARLRWVPLTQMRVNPLAQRDLNQARVSTLAAAFDLEQMGAPTVSHRGGWFYLIDGQHRIAALKQWLRDWEGQQVLCWCYEGLSEAAEAEVFLTLKDTLPVRAFAKFKVSVQAGREAQGDVDRIVRALGLRIARGSGGISEVATLRRVHARGGPAVLSRALRIIRDTYGKPGWTAMSSTASACCASATTVTSANTAQSSGCHRRMSACPGGSAGAGQLRQSTGSAPAQCVAAAAVEVINRGAGGRKLSGWWRNGQ
jgi:hypothetical protein